MTSARKRIARELAAGSSTPDLITCRPAGPDDLLTLHYALRGPSETPYAGGVYHGLIKFPEEYPLKPPGIIMLTPSGRFECGMRLCLSMSDYHVRRPGRPRPVAAPCPAPLTLFPPLCPRAAARVLAAHLVARQDPAGPAVLHGHRGALHWHHRHHGRAEARLCGGLARL